MTHKTKNVTIKTIKANVDIKMIPIVNWLNSFSSVQTLYCCQGDKKGDLSELPKDKPYVMFTCLASLDLINILNFTRKNGTIDVTWYETNFGNQPILRYTLRFYTCKEMNNLVEKIKND